MFVCDISLSHSESGKFGSAPASAALRFFLNVCIERSTRLLRCFMVVLADNLHFVL